MGQEASRPITADLAVEQGLTRDEYARIVDLLGRPPTFEELGVFGVMWSEHCSYKSSRALLRQLPTQGPQVLQGPGENAGAVDIGDGLAAVFKIESHNHPSFVEPFQGAATGVGGILRDVFTMGARPIAILDSIRFGGIDHPRTPHLVRGVVAGIGHYGNCIGVPTVGGEVVFDPAYERNILVNAFTIGIAPADRLFRAKAAGPGNPVIYVGSRTGRDGIHGASLLASAALDASAPEKRPAVQVGDPFAEKLLLEACLELMKTEHVVAIQDMGAAGLTSTSIEMAGRGGAGIEIDLDAVPLREEGLTAYEILLSESQERMLLVAHAGSERAVLEIFARWDLQAEVIGRVTNDGVFRARWRGEEVCALPVSALTDSAPVYRRPAEEPGRLEEAQRLDLADRHRARRSRRGAAGAAREPEPVLPGVGVPAIRPVRRREHRRCGRAPTRRWCASRARAARSRSRSTATIATGSSIRISAESSRWSRPRATSCRWARARSRSATASTTATPNVPTSCGSSSRASRASATPASPSARPWSAGTSASTTRPTGTTSRPRPPSRWSACSTTSRRMLTPWWRGEGDVIVLLGRTREELGGSEYLAVVHRLGRGTPPWIDLEAEKRLHRLVLEAAHERLLRSAHDVGEGGLAVALAECCFGGARLGARVAIEGGMRRDALLFGESQSRMLLSLRRRNLSRLRDLARHDDLPVQVLGEVRGHNLVIDGLVDLPVEVARERWRRALERRIGG